MPVDVSPSTQSSAYRALTMACGRMCCYPGIVNWRGSTPPSPTAPTGPATEPSSSCMRASRGRQGRTGGEWRSCWAFTRGLSCVCTCTWCACIFSVSSLVRLLLGVPRCRPTGLARTRTFGGSCLCHQMRPLPLLLPLLPWLQPLGSRSDVPRSFPSFFSFSCVRNTEESSS